MSSVAIPILLLAAASCGQAHGQDGAIVRLRHPSHVVRLHAAAELGERRADAPAAVRALKVALRDPDEVVRFYAADSLGKIGAKAAAAEWALLLALDDESWIVRRKIAIALGRVRTAELVYLTRLKAVYPEEKTRQHAHLLLLYYQQDPPPAEVLYKPDDLAHEHWDIRLRALRYFWRLQKPEHAAAVLNLLDDKHVAVRVMAEHLFETGNRDAQTALMFQGASFGRWRPWAIPHQIDGIRDDDFYSLIAVRRLYAHTNNEVRSSLLKLIARHAWKDDATIDFLKRMTRSNYGAHRTRALRLLDERMISGG